MASIYKALFDIYDVKLITTGQHKELLTQSLESFKIKADIDLKVMNHSQSLSKLTAKILLKLEKIILLDKPNLIIVHGDTTTAFAAGLTAFYLKIPFVHIESGLRTFNLQSPFPEEFNRQCIAKMALHHFSPDEKSKQNLIQEGISPSNITNTFGSTIIDAIKLFKTPPTTMENIVTFTIHRRDESEQLQKIMEGIYEAAITHKNINFIFPMHPNPIIQKLANEIFKNVDNVLLKKAYSYPEFLNLIAQSLFVITDSGGVQEEAVYLGKKVLVIREQTERSDGLASGQTKIIGKDKSNIILAIDQTLKENDKFANQVVHHSPTQTIIEVIKNICL